MTSDRERRRRANWLIKGLSWLSGLSNRQIDRLLYTLKPLIDFQTGFSDCPQ